jgi:hypothetical protein
MGLLSSFLNIRVNAIKILHRDDGKVVFLMATQDGFKERLFKCILYSLIPIDQAKDIQKIIENIRSTRFYAASDEVRDGIPPILRKHPNENLRLGIGTLTVKEFGPEQLHTYGKSKQWFK